MTREQANVLCAALDDCEITHSRQEEYSGRGMGNKTTHAVICPSALEALGAVVAYLKRLSASFIATLPQLDDLRQDSMGKDSVVLY